MVGVAVKVTADPAHMGFVPAVIAILFEGTTVGFTVMVIMLLVAVCGIAHVALEVITAVTCWPLVRPDEVNVDELVPVFTPFTFH